MFFGSGSGNLRSVRLRAGRSLIWPQTAISSPDPTATWRWSWCARPRRRRSGPCRSSARGDKLAADGAAVDAMRAFLGTVDFDGVVVIGEGEKDNAPMLFNGEHVGTARGPQCDIAVDPIDGTSMTAHGRQNALSMIAVSDRGTMLDASSVFYMDKLVTGHRGIGVSSTGAVGRREHPRAGEGQGQAGRRDGRGGARPPAARGADRGDPRGGCGDPAVLDGDVAGGINAARYETRDRHVHRRGRQPGGRRRPRARSRRSAASSRRRLAPKDDAERQRGIDAGLDMDRSTTRTIWSAATTRSSSRPASPTAGWSRACAARRLSVHRVVVLRGESGTLRRIASDHLAAKWL